MIRLPPGVRLVLASGSPRRADLLHVAGLDFEIRAADVDETPRPAELPTVYVARLAAEKARAAARPGEIVVGADTTVDLDGRIVGKPSDADDAAQMLSALAGRTHLVHTGVHVVGPAGASSTLVTTSVTFVEVSDETLAWYVATGDWRDKAGGYAIQGAGAALVERVDGSVSNVIGLPLAETIALLRSVHPAPEPPSPRNFPPMSR